MLPIARVYGARPAVLELLARHDVRDAGTDERIQSLVDDLANMLRLAAAGRLTVADAVDALGTPERTEAITLADLVRTALPGGGEARAEAEHTAADQRRAAVRRVLLARDDAARASRIVRPGDDPAALTALPLGSVVVPVGAWVGLFHACLDLAREAGIDLARGES